MAQHHVAGGRPSRSDRGGRRLLRRLAICAVSAALLSGTSPAPLWSQEAPPGPPAGSPPGSPPGSPGEPPPAAGQEYPPEQLDAILAPVALYPDELLTQVLMASAYPLQVVEAARWLENPANKALRGEALAAALAPMAWEPSVKSLVPFPQVLAMMNAHLDWTQQLGYAVAVQQPAVMEAIQRLRNQAQIAGALRSSDQQVVRTENDQIVIAPAQPTVVYVPTYNPAVVYGAWPYPAYPPVYLPPPPGYPFGAALATGLAFGAGIAVVGGLWGWARPNWGRHNVYVDVNRYNTINVNRPPINNPNWRPGGPGYRPPPGGPRYRPVGGGVGGPVGGGYRPPPGAAPGYRPPPAGGYRPPPAAGYRPPPAGGPGYRPPPPNGVRPPGTQPGGGARPPPPAGGGRPVGGPVPGPRPPGGGGNRPPAAANTGNFNRPQGSAANAGGFSRPQGSAANTGGFNRPQAPNGGGSRPPPAASGGGNRAVQARPASPPPPWSGGGGGGGIRDKRS